MIGSQRCDLFPNCTIFISKLHPFVSQWQWDSNTKQPMRFQGFFRLTNHIAGKEKTKKPLFGSIVIKCNFKMDLIKWQSNCGSCNFGLKSYLWNQIKLALHAHSILKSSIWFQIKLHSIQVNYHYIDRTLRALWLVKNPCFMRV